MMMLNVYIWDFSLCQHTAMCWHFLSSFLISRPDHGNKRHLPEQPCHQDHLCRTSPLPKWKVCCRNCNKKGYNCISFHLLPPLIFSSSAPISFPLYSARSFSDMLYVQIEDILIAVPIGSFCCCIATLTNCGDACSIAAASTGNILPTSMLYFPFIFFIRFS